MVRKYIFGEPIETDAVVKEIASSAWSDGVFQKKEDGFHYSLKEDEIVYGLGENVRGINKRGWRYISNCSDNPNHCENTNSLYGAHNFIMVGDGVHETYGLFVDTPGRVTFDIGYTDIDDLCISMEEENYKIYLIEAASYRDVVKEFRELIGRSYIAPRWAFGYGQSRWCSRKHEKSASVLGGRLPTRTKAHKTSVVPPWFTAPSRARPRCCGSGFLLPLLTAGRYNGRSRRGLSTLALRPRSSETIFGSLFPALFHRPGSLEGSMRKPTLLFTAIFVILHT